MDPAAAASARDAMEPPKVEVRRNGALVQFILNRPKALNAFDDDMCRVLATEIPIIARNPDVYIVALTSSSGKAFSAGGDVKALIAEERRQLNGARLIFAAEYHLNWLIECFSKPTISLIDGICMGSGVGLTAYNTHRVAGENYKFAMPETAIGLFPDVGAAYVFAHLPWPVGLYLGLTGRAIGRRDAHWLGLVTHCISSARFPGILAALADAEPVDPMLDGFHEDEPAGPLQNDAAMIGDFFGSGSLDEIMRRLAAATGVAQSWALATHGDLLKRSPTSLRITDRHIRSARTLDLRQTLIQDYRLACRCLAGADFREGVRAMLVDKDGAPKWQPATLCEVTPDMIAHYFAPLEGEELMLPTRKEMQVARV